MLLLPVPHAPASARPKRGECAMLVLLLLLLLYSARTPLPTCCCCCCCYSARTDRLLLLLLLPHSPASARPKAKRCRHSPVLLRISAPHVATTPQAITRLLYHLAPQRIVTNVEGT
jgi:hypothetical protein